MVEYAKMRDLDCLKGYVRVIKGEKSIDMDIIDVDNTENMDVMRKIIAGQSTRIDIIIKRDFLKRHNIKFDMDFKVGEDTIFYADLFMCKPKIEYYDSFVHYHYKRSDIKNLSSTQQYHDRELNKHIDVWNIVEKKLNTIGMSYFELRLPTAIKITLSSIINYSNGKISKKSFFKFSDFINQNIEYMENLNLLKRYEEVFESIVEKDYEKFLETSKKRLLIAGHDLKFIFPVIKYLEDEYAVKIDKWEGHVEHDEEKSTELLNWADFIICEWLLGNSVWYSNRKLHYQKIIIRAHRSEITVDYGDEVNFGNVDSVLTVNYYFLELFSKRFKIPREKMKLLSNFVECNIYSGEKVGDYKHNIAMVGYLPKEKGLLKALKILKMLKEHDNKFKLYLFGKSYKELDWVWNDVSNRSYFLKCEDYIKINNLKDSVIFKGWIDRSEMFHDIGYVVSLSEVESFHLAPAEGFCDNTLGLLIDWPGVEYIYPEEIIFNSIEEIKDKILVTYKNEDEYKKLVEDMKEYIIKEFDIDKFVNHLKLILIKATFS
jgi:glycosyltransferase involved in cell wall biosynthesis